MIFNAYSDVVAYFRVSTDDQAERETIESQVEFTRKYCDLHQINLIDSFKDDGVTGTIPLSDRPEGKRLIELAKSGKIKVMLIYNLKRLGRTARVILNAVHELEKYGVVIKSMTEPFDTGNPTGRFLLTILAGVAELDRETLLETMWHGANRAARKGKWLGGIVPYGYRVNEDRFLEINDDPLPGKEEMSEAGVIRLMYYLIANQKYSTIKAADYMNAMSIPPSYVKDGRKVKKGKRKENTAGIWTPGRIRNMIVNTTYKGIHIYGKRSDKDRELITRQVPAIISEEMWDEAQQVLRDNQLECMKNTKRPYLLRGLIKCGACGLTYHGTSYPGEKRKLKAYYVCNGKTVYKGPLQGKCKSKNIPADWIEDLVWKECVEFIMNPGDALQELATSMEVRQSQKDSLFFEKQILIKSIQDKDSDRQAILDLFRKKIISASDVEKQLTAIATERIELDQRIRALDDLLTAEEEMSSKFTTAEMLLHSLQDKLSQASTFEVKREIIRILVKEVVIETKGPDDDGNIRRPLASIHVRYSFSPPRLFHESLPLRILRFRQPILPLHLQPP